MKADHRKAIIGYINQLRDRHSSWRVFSDFVEMSALSISNAVDPAERDEREARYLAIAAQYSPEELALFPQMLGELTSALEEGFDDVLGRLFHELELHSKWHGQFFTPYELAHTIALMTLGDRPHMTREIEAKGYLNALEPACGAGAMVIALAAAMKDQGINYQRSLHVTAVDIDPKCVHMAYLQLSLLGVPAVVVHGNSLSLEERSHWRTPMHVFGNWEWRLRRSAPATAAIEPPTIPPATEPAEITLDLFAQEAA